MTLRCLIVDDSPRFLAAARGHLEREGIAVVGVASSLGQALQHAERLRPDVTLVDLDLGGESGLELARRLCRAPAPGWRGSPTGARLRLPGSFAAGRLR